MTTGVSHSAWYRFSAGLFLWYPVALLVCAVAALAGIVN
jgi:hypothetical protein